MRVFKNPAGGKGFAKIWGDTPEAKALDQIGNVMSLPFVRPYVAVMPDCHGGYGATIGSVIPTEDVIIPSAVGMDIGCGVIAVQADVVAGAVKADAGKLFHAISSRVPHGRTGNGNPKRDCGAWDSFDSAPAHVREAWSCHPHNLGIEFENLCLRYPSIAEDLRRANSVEHLGTLGTGNHFIELSEDKDGRMWIVVHSGSRGIGGAIAKVFMRRAKKLCDSWYVDLIDRDLAYIPSTSSEYQAYLDCAVWAQKFADVNRRLMVRMVREAIESVLDGEPVGLSQEYSCHHNFVAREHHFGKNLWVTRKGAVRAREKDKLVIPGSMGGDTFLCTGKGNVDSFCSAPHGAGRRMSRGQARKTITVGDHVKATDGVFCRKDAAILDESPGAYKDIDAVMEASQEFVRVDHVIKQFVCVKG